jgi:hypothetical protein
LCSLDLLFPAPSFLLRLLELLADIADVIDRFIALSGKLRERR